MLFVNRYHLLSMVVLYGKCLGPGLASSIDNLTRDCDGKLTIITFNAITQVYIELRESVVLDICTPCNQRCML